MPNFFGVCSIHVLSYVLFRVFDMEVLLEINQKRIPIPKVEIRSKKP